MSHLQEAVRTHFSSLTSLKQQAAQYRQEKEGKSRIFYNQSWSFFHLLPIYFIIFLMIIYF